MSFKKIMKDLTIFHPNHHHADINAWAELHRKIPDDIDEPFVVHYEYGTSVVNSAILEFDDLDDDYGCLFDSQFSQQVESESEKDFPIFFRFVMVTNRLFDYSNRQNIIFYIIF